LTLTAGKSAIISVPAKAELMPLRRFVGAEQVVGEG